MSQAIRDCSFTGSGFIRYAFKFTAITLKYRTGSRYAVTSFKTKHVVTIFDWVTNSPDLPPIGASESRLCPPGSYIGSAGERLC